jgi:transposase
VTDFVLQGGRDKKYEVGEAGTMMTHYFIEEPAVKSYVGIDVGAPSVVVSARRAGRVVSTHTFARTPEGHQALWLQRRAGEIAGAALEATGVYDLDLAVRLRQAGWTVAVIHPRSFPHFAQLKLRHGKTDVADAARERINPHPHDRQPLDHLCQAKGIGEASAFALLAELAVLPRHLKSAQISRYAGLDVRPAPA